LQAFAGGKLEIQIRVIAAARERFPEDVVEFPVGQSEAIEEKAVGLGSRSHGVRSYQNRETAQPPPSARRHRQSVGPLR
jgi:hypothetical protein